MASDKVMNVTTDNFHKEVIDVSGSVLVDFWAPWCGACRTLTPIVEEIAEAMHPSLSVKKVNADLESDLVNTYQITTIPTLLFFKDGILLDRKSGKRSRKELDIWLKGLL